MKLKSLLSVLSIISRIAYLVLLISVAYDYYSNNIQPNNLRVLIILLLAISSIDTFSARDTLEK